MTESPWTDPNVRLFFAFLRVLVLLDPVNQETLRKASR